MLSAARMRWLTLSKIDTPHPRIAEKPLILCRGSNLLVFGSWQLGKLRFAEFFNNLSSQVASKSWRVNGGAKPIDFESQDVIPIHFWTNVPSPGFESDESFVRCAKGLQEVHTGVERWINFSVSFASLLALRMETSYKNMRSLCFLVLQCHVVLLT